MKFKTRTHAFEMSSKKRKASSKKKKPNKKPRSAVEWVEQQAAKHGATTALQALDSLIGDPMDEEEDKEQLCGLACANPKGPVFYCKEPVADGYNLCKKHVHFARKLGFKKESAHKTRTQPKRGKDKDKETEEKTCGFVDGNDIHDRCLEKCVADSIYCAKHDAYVAAGMKLTCQFCSKEIDSHQDSNFCSCCDTCFDDFWCEEHHQVTCTHKKKKKTKEEKKEKEIERTGEMCQFVDGLDFGESCIKQRAIGSKFCLEHKKHINDKTETKCRFCPATIDPERVVKWHECCAQCFKDTWCSLCSSHMCGHKDKTFVDAQGNYKTLKGHCPYGNSIEDNPHVDNVCKSLEEEPCAQCWEAGPKCTDCKRACKPDHLLCLHCLDKMRSARESKQACLRCNKPTANGALHLGRWYCPGCHPKEVEEYKYRQEFKCEKHPSVKGLESGYSECKLCLDELASLEYKPQQQHKCEKYPYESGLDSGYTRCRKCELDANEEKKKKKSEERKSAMDLWECPKALAGHKWTGAKLAQDCKCMFCGIDHPGKQKPNCDVCHDKIVDHGYAYWKGASAYCSKTCRDKHTVRCEHCKRRFDPKEACPDGLRDSPPTYVCKKCSLTTCGKCKKKFPFHQRANRGGGYPFFCSDKCANEKTCGQCQYRLEDTKTEYNREFFCDDQCLKEYKDTHLTPKNADRKARASPQKKKKKCGFCNKEIGEPEAYTYEDEFPGEYFCDSGCKHKRDIGEQWEQNKKAKTKFVPVNCSECNTKIKTRKQSVQDKDFPGEWFCSDECGDEYAMNHQREMNSKVKASKKR